MPEKPRDKWDKASIILQPIGGLFAALTVAALGLIGSNLLSKAQNLEARVRLHTELMSRREESDSALRKDMFSKILDTFVQTQKTSLDARVLNLELLAYNFHESLNMKPVFADLRKEIAASGRSDAQDYMRRLEKVAGEITRKQLVVLESHGKAFRRDIDLAAVRDTPGGLVLKDETLTLDNVTRVFQIVAKESDPKSKELKLRLSILTPGPGGGVATSEAEFSAGFFDFPMIDNTRLSQDQRFAITLNRFGKEAADISGVYFPGAYASLRERPYYEELVRKLLPGD